VLTLSSVLTNLAHSYIHHFRACRYSWEGTGSLSIKAFLRGRAHYHTGHSEHLINPAHYLILNHEQWYRIEIEEPTESFCLFFSARDGMRVYRSIAASLEAQLDDPHATLPLPTFVERTHSMSDQVGHLLTDLHRIYHHMPGDILLHEEQMSMALQACILSYLRVRREIAALEGSRLATKIKTYRRAWIARDFIDAASARALSLEMIGQAASLSPNHLLRVFRATFHMTPHAYVTQRRLQTACCLLATTDMPVMDICLQVGYSSLGSFSTLFRRRAGISPYVYRRTNQLRLKKQ
jgi:AraC-like DNA-binding protein